MMSDSDDDERSSVFYKYSKKIEDRLGTKGNVYQHQIDAVEMVKQKFSVNQNGVALVVLPTGCGKTGVAVLSAYVLAAKCVLVVTPSTHITEQIGEVFTHREQNFLLKRGIIKTRKYLPPAVIARSAREVKPSCFNSDLMVVNAHKIRKKSPAEVQITDIERDMFDLVIVDEAHHYPAETWKLLVDHFINSKRLFLTATPYYKKKPMRYNPSPVDDVPVDPEPILPITYQLTKEEAVARKIIRETQFDEQLSTPPESDEAIFTKIASRIKFWLDKHDKLDPNWRHQAMVLAQTKEDLNPASKFKTVYNSIHTGEQCEVYVSGKSKKIAEEFNNQKLRTLVVVGKLIEGYDNKHVSVVAIIRNVSSRVLFTQFVGRAVRKGHPEEPDSIQAVVISHPHYNQQKNYATVFGPQTIIAEEEEEEEDL